MLAVGGLNQLLEDVFEALLAEIAFLLRHPFLQTEMRFDDEGWFGHDRLLGTLLPWRGTLRDPGTRDQLPAL